MKRRSAIEPGLDRYLSRQLHEIYDPVLNEPIPDDLMALLNQFDSKAPVDDNEGGED